MSRAAELLARGRARRLLPNSLTRPVFWRFAIRDQTALTGVSVRSTVRFREDRSLDLVLDLSSRQNWLMLFEGFRSAGEGDVLAEFCRRAADASCVIDVGVNHGLYLYHAVTHCRRSCRIIGLEANPVLVASVNQNLARNGIGPLVELVAATDGDGPVTLYVGSDDMVSSLLQDHVQQFGAMQAQVEVPGCSLDSLVARQELRPDLIKIDVESHELVVLSGARKTLREHQPTLIIEVTPRTFADVDELLRAHGYEGRLFADHSLHEADPAIVGATGYSNLIYEVSR